MKIQTQGEKVSAKIGKAPSLQDIRALFIRVMGPSLAQAVADPENKSGLAARSYGMWAAFRAGLELAARGEIAADVVQAVRAHMASELGNGLANYRQGYCVEIQQGHRAMLVRLESINALPFATYDKEQAKIVRETLAEAGHCVKVVDVWFALPMVDRRGKGAGEPLKGQFFGSSRTRKAHARGTSPVSPEVEGPEGTSDTGADQPKPDIPNSSEAGPEGELLQPLKTRAHARAGGKEGPAAISRRLRTRARVREGGEEPHPEKAP